MISATTRITVCLMISMSQIQHMQVQAVTKPKCSSLSNCTQCMQTPGCAWCSAESLSIDSQQRCAQNDVFISNQLKCEANKLYLWENDLVIIKEDKLSGLNDNNENNANPFTFHKAIQLSPQLFEMTLRKGTTQNFSLNFALDRNQPLDLYYLMDLSNSMTDDKENLSRLGRKLAQQMKNLTSDFRLGFGSFVDKVLMPYVETSKEKLNNPCKGCARPYSFRHHMNLDKDAKLFEERVTNARTSGNVDESEGGFDALMQAIVCGNRIGWRRGARKLIVYSSDAPPHTAGDGKLGGVVEPNDGKCHLDKDGMYIAYAKYDYPSISFLNKKMVDEDIFVIFAVTESRMNLYRDISESMKGTFYGQMDSNSANVVDLISTQYYAITSKVQLNAKHSRYLEVKFYTNCGIEGEEEKQQSNCSKVIVKKLIHFTVSIKLLECPMDKQKHEETVEIKQEGLSEVVQVKVNMRCQCDCDNRKYSTFVENSAECSNNGNKQCGTCVCNKDYFGSRCECSLAEGHEREDQCMPSDEIATKHARLCSGYGQCVCGVCQCNARENPREKYSGKYCECKNFSCLRGRNNTVCSGDSQGECVCGKCVCKPAWTGLACECYQYNDTCVAPGSTEVCSGRGNCVCGECECAQYDKKNYYIGDYCEYCPNCKGLCSQYQECIECLIFKNNSQSECNCDYMIIEEMESAIVERDSERLCTITDEDDCTYDFVYDYIDKTSVKIRTETSKRCPKPVNLMVVVLSLIGTILAIGLLTLIIWKIVTTIHDKREYAKFEDETKKAKWEAGVNPIYKNATTTFKNPAYMG